MDKKISILGCGWLGFPLAQHFIGKDYLVKGSTTSEDKILSLQQTGIEPFLLDIQNSITFQPTFFQSDYLIINVPPTKVLRSVDSYRLLVKAIEEVGVIKVVFVSSTSVYLSNNKEVIESDTDLIADGVNPLLDIERIFQRASFHTTVIRFGGLVGGERYPGRFFTSGREVSGAQQPVNLIHLDDCIQLIDAIIETDAFPNVLNGVADTHPTKRDFYTLAAQLAGRKPPVFVDDDSSFKVVGNQLMKQTLGVTLKHADLMEMLQDNSLWEQRL